MALQSTLPNLLTFCAAFELRSFTKAARQLGVTPQAASRSVSRLEETLSTQLFRRTTRLITPTDAAQAYYKIAKQALAMLSHAEQELGRQTDVRAGVVRVSAPTTYGHHRLLPSLGVFRERFPHIELEIHIGNRNVDFAVEGFDFAIRMGSLRDQSLVARTLGDFALGVYAAPSYLSVRRPPRNPAQLADHTCIGFTMPSTGRLLPWTFSPAPRSWVPPAPVRCAEDVLATISLARAGVGLTQTYDFLVEREVERGQLVEVMRDWRGMSRPFSLVYPRGAKPSPAARALIDFIVAARP
jgi:DNA-binding transcriptional LysR family regulator